MPFRPYLVNQKHVVIKKSPGYLEMETGSGRNIFLLFVVFVLLFQNEWLMYPGLITCVIVWTYSKRWILSQEQNTIRSRGRIVGIPYDEVVQDLSTVIELLVERKCDSQGIGYVYKLRVRFSDASMETVAIRNSCDPLLGVIKDMRTFLPAAKVTLPDGCAGSEKV